MATHTWVLLALLVISAAGCWPTYSEARRLVGGTSCLSGDNMTQADPQSVNDDVRRRPSSLLGLR